MSYRRFVELGRVGPKRGCKVHVQFQQYSNRRSVVLSLFPENTVVWFRLSPTAWHRFAAFLLHTEQRSKKRQPVSAYTGYTFHEHGQLKEHIAHAVRWHEKKLFGIKHQSGLARVFSLEQANAFGADMSRTFFARMRNCCLKADQRLRRLKL